MVKYMDLIPYINIEELQQAKYDVYCTLYGWNKNHVLYSTYHTPLVVNHQC
jgi:hypothetical protein